MAKKVPVGAIEKLNKVSAESVAKHTGKNWDQWVKILDTQGATHMTHKEIVAFLGKKYKIKPWWQQIVTSAYEVHIGRKFEGRNAKGEYMTAATRTFYVSADKLWDLLESPQGQAVWLKPLSPFKFKPKNVFETEDGVFGEIRTMKEGVRLRMTWQDTDWPKATILQVYLGERGDDKSILVFNHEKIKDGRTKTVLKERWLQILSDLAELTPPRKSPKNK